MSVSGSGLPTSSPQFSEGDLVTIKDTSTIAVRNAAVVRFGVKAKLIDPTAVYIVGWCVPALNNDVPVWAYMLGTLGDWKTEKELSAEVEAEMTGEPEEVRKEALVARIYAAERRLNTICLPESNLLLHKIG